MKQLVSPKQVAQAIGVSESSLKRWCDKGLLETVRTAGGHRRLPVEAVVQFLRQSGQQIVEPELLGLPSATGQGTTKIERVGQQVRDALIAGQEDAVRRMIFDLYLSGISACDLCDSILAGAFHDIGFEWECGRLAVYRERRACEIALRAIYEVRSALPRSPLDAPLAIGGTLSHDASALPTAMVELVLREAGWRAESYGSGLPVVTACEAIRDAHPRLFWLSATHIDQPAAFLADYDELSSVAEACCVPLTVGGRALSDELRRKMRYAAYCDTLRHLVTFAATLYRPAAATPPAERT